MKTAITRNRRTTQMIFDDGDTLIKYGYQDVHAEIQSMLRHNLGIASHPVALDLIKIATRFIGKIKDEMIKKHLYMDTLALMASETFNDKQVTQMLNLIHFPASNSNKCVFSSRKCQAIFYQIRDGISTNQKSSPLKQQSLEDLVVEEKTSEEEIQARRELKDIYISFKHDASLLNSRMDSLEEYKRNRETEIAKEQAMIKEIENTSENIRSLWQKIDSLEQKIDSLETQKKTASNGHIKQTKQ